MREMKGPEQLCARDEGARAALCARGRDKGSSMRKRKGPGKHWREMKIFHHNFFNATLHFLYISEK